MTKDVTKTIWIFTQICSKKKVPKSYLFVVFKVPIPAWSPGWPRGGFQTQKHLKMQLQTLIFCCLGTLLSPSLETLWKYFVCSMNINFIVLDVNLLFSLLRLGGKTYGGCFPDASQMPPRCFQDAPLLNDSFSMIPLPIIALP